MGNMATQHQGQNGGNGNNNNNNSNSNNGNSNNVQNNVQSAVQTVASQVGRFSLPRPRSLGDFMIYPSRWRLPNLRNFPSLVRRIKTNLLYFQTNYLILNSLLFALFMILSMKTLLTGVISAVCIIVAVLFFFEHIPQARQIKQNYPTMVIVSGIVLILVTWHALRTILFVAAAAVSPFPIWILHASLRNSNYLVDSGSMGGDYYSRTPVGQLMQMFGIEPRASITE